MKRGRALLIAILAFLGMTDALFLSLERNAGPIPCHITSGCNDVLTSRYSALSGIPISWFGLAFYVVVFSLAIYELMGTAKTLQWIFWLATPAVAISAGLVGIQSFILKSYCEYCLLSAILVSMIFLLSIRPWLNRHLQ